MLALGWVVFAGGVLRESRFSACDVFRSAARSDERASISDDPLSLFGAKPEAGWFSRSWHAIISRIAAGETKSVLPTRVIFSLPLLASARKLAGVMAPAKKLWQAASSVRNGASVSKFIPTYPCLLMYPMRENAPTASTYTATAMASAFSEARRGGRQVIATAPERGGARPRQVPSIGRQ